MLEQVITPDKPMAKPFPWRCPKCRQATVNRVTMPYRCRRKHGDRIVTMEIPNLAVPRCSNCGELVFDYVADEQIREAFHTSFGSGEVIVDGTSLDTLAKSHALVKHLLTGSTVLSFIVGLFLLFIGQSTFSLFLAACVIVFLICRSIVDFDMRIRRLETHFMDHARALENGTHSHEGGE